MKNLRKFSEHSEYESTPVEKYNVRVCTSPSPIHVHYDSFPFDSRIEYLESTGTQWINTQVTPTANTIMTIDMTITNNADVNNGLIESGKRFHIGKLSSKFHFGIAGSHIYGEVQDNNRHILELNGNGTAKWDNTSYTVSSTPVSGITLKIHLFGRNTNGTTNNFIIGRMWSCKIVEDSVTILDLIPVRVGTVGYLYDKISRQLFGNAGTGEFVLGPDITNNDLL